MREEGEEEEEEDEQGGERDAVERRDGERGKEGREGEAVSGSACKKEQVSIYTASPRIKDPAEYVGKSRRVLVLFFLFATHTLFLSLYLSLFLPSQHLLFLAVRPPSAARISSKIGK